MDAFHTSVKIHGNRGTEKEAVGMPTESNSKNVPEQEEHSNQCIDYLKNYVIVCAQDIIIISSESDNEYSTNFPKILFLLVSGILE